MKVAVYFKNTYNTISKVKKYHNKQVLSALQGKDSLGNILKYEFYEVTNSTDKYDLLITWIDDNDIKGFGKLFLNS